MEPDPIYKHIGAVIKAKRNKLDWKQEKLAGELGISRGSLANVETGRQSILVHQLYRFAKALGVSPFDLLPQVQLQRLNSGDTHLPLPHDLNVQQKRQIFRLFAEVENNKIRPRKGRRAKSSR